jgi:hypothetical protein
VFPAAVLCTLGVQDLIAAARLAASKHGMTGGALLHKMDRMKKIFLTRIITRIGVAGVVLAMLALTGVAMGQKDKEEEPTSWMYFVVLKEDNGKPVRNAAVIMHSVNAKGKQERGGMELKTDAEGKANFDGVPYGALRVQVLAPGFQTFGEDYTIDKAKMEITIKVKRPQNQYSVYDDHAKDPGTPKPDAPKPDAPKQDPPPADPNQKPN